MAWLTGTAEPAADPWQAIRDLNPDGVQALLDIQRAVWDHADPVLLELCRLRLAQLMGAPAYAALRSSRAQAAGVDEELIAEIPSWPTSPRFGPRERACLELAEQFLIDVNGITDAHVAAVLEHLTVEETFALANALWVFEQFQRFCLVLDLEPTPELAGLS